MWCKIFKFLFIIKIAYHLFLFQVSRLAGVLVKYGVQKGDRVLIYMPMIPEAMFAMLACARIGAIHSLVFGGFASKELATRINHAKVGIMDHVGRLIWCNGKL